MRLTFEYTKTAGAGFSPQAVHMMDNGLRFIYLTSDGLVEANECFPDMGLYDELAYTDKGRISADFEVSKPQLKKVAHHGAYGFWSSEDTLSFKIPFRDSKRVHIDSEKKIQIVDDIYKVRTVTDSKDTEGNSVTEVYAEAEFYDLTFSVRKEERTFEAEYAETAMAYALAGTEWSVGTVNVRTKRTWTSSEKNALSILRNVADLHGGDLVFDCPNRLVHLLTVNGKDSGAFFAYRKNMKSIQRVVDTRSLVTRLYAVGAGGIFAGAFSDTLSSYKNLNENEFSQKLSDMDVPELFDEVNKLSGEGVEYPELDDFAFALLENIERTPNRILINAITNKNNHPNLRKMCMELLDTKNEDENGNSTLTDKEGKKLEALLLDENEDASVKFYVIDILPRNDSTINALKTAIAVEEDVVSERALQILNYFAPEQARPIAEEYIKSGENVILGISTINYQMCNSKNDSEKDEWIDFLLSKLEEVKDAPDMYLREEPGMSDASVMKGFIIRSLESFYYRPAIYALLNSEYVSTETKKKVVSFKQSGNNFFSDILATNPTDTDIEMVIKSIDLSPVLLAELVEPLKIAAQKSSKEYNIDMLAEKVNIAVAEDDAQRDSMYAGREN